MTKLCAIDFETANASSLSACAVGISVMKDGVLTENWSTLIKPPKKHDEFSFHNIMVHGITKNMVENAPAFDEIYPKLLELMDGAVLCAHNAEFDMKVLQSLCLHYHLPIPKKDYFCTVRLSRSALPNLERHRLNVVAEHFEIELNHHDASSDARACVLIASNIMAASDIYDVDTLMSAYRQTLKHMG